MKICQAKNNLCIILKNTPRPLFESETILAFALKKNREYILAHPQQPIDKKQYLWAKKMAKKRARFIPLAYLCGEKWFYGLKFKVNKSVLIPRPETELMVDSVLEYYQKTTPQRTMLADIGTGSGSIIISVLKNISPNKQLLSIAIDISERALKIAKINALKHKLANKIIFLKGKGILPLKKKYNFAEFDYLLIMANLPYLTKKQIKESPTIKKEPKIALFGGKNGLKHYSRLLNEVKDIKQKFKFLKIRLWLEIDHSQRKTIIELIKKIAPEAQTKVIKDLAGYDRLVFILWQ